MVLYRPGSGSKRLAEGPKLRSRKSWLVAIVALTFVVACESAEPAAVVTLVPSTTTASVPAGFERAVVASVTDGDTVRLADGRAVRYIGMDTPETVAPGQPVQCYGREASARNSELVLGKTVLLEKDRSETDRYDRLLRYVYLDDGRMVNEVLIAEGFAISIAYPPDTKYQVKLSSAEEQAQQAGLGRWTACVAVSTPTEHPATAAPPVFSSCPQGCAIAPEGCVIKGNISQSGGDKIYHVPGQENYNETVISPNAGERWFCTEDEAVANGWRKAQR